MKMLLILSGKLYRGIDIYQKSSKKLHTAVINEKLDIRQSTVEQSESNQKQKTDRQFEMGERDGIFDVINETKI